MSRASTSSNAGYGWPSYGQVPLTRWSKCPRPEPLVRLRSKTWENDNYGREFMKCKSIPQPGKILKKCNFFMWMDEYIKKLHLDGIMKGRGSMGATEEMVVSNFRSEQATTATWDMCATELKKLKDKLSLIIGLLVIMIFIGFLVLMMSYGSKQ